MTNIDKLREKLMFTPYLSVSEVVDMTCKAILKDIEALDECNILVNKVDLDNKEGIFNLPKEELIFKKGFFTEDIKQLLTVPQSSTTSTANLGEGVDSPQENGITCKPDKVHACNNLHAADTDVCECGHKMKSHDIYGECWRPDCDCKKSKEVAKHQHIKPNCKLCMSMWKAGYDDGAKAKEVGKDGE